MCVLTDSECSPLANGIGDRQFPERNLVWMIEHLPI